MSGLPELGSGLDDTPFNVPNLVWIAARPHAHTRVGWYRSVYNVPHACAMQSFVAELAHHSAAIPRTTYSN